MNSRFCIVLFFWFGFNVLSIAQLPITDMYDISFIDSAGCWTIDEISMLNTFNEQGYNNQPHAIDVNVFLISTNKYKESTEILQLDFSSTSAIRLTNNEDPEYSPQIRPYTEQLSVVAVTEQDVQQLRLYNDSRTSFKTVFPDVEKVAYYTWINKEKIAFSVLTGIEEQMVLLIGDAETDDYSIRVENVGRCIKTNRHIEDEFFFVHKLTSKIWYIKRYNIQENKISIVTQLPEDVEDFCLLDNGNFVIGNGTSLYGFCPSTDSDWKKLTDLSVFGISNIKRLSSTKNHFILCDVK